MVSFFKNTSFLLYLFFFLHLFRLRIGELDTSVITYCVNTLRSTYAKFTGENMDNSNCLSREDLKLIGNFTSFNFHISHYFFVYFFKNFVYVLLNFCLLFAYFFCPLFVYFSFTFCLLHFLFTFCLLFMYFLFTFCLFFCLPFCLHFIYFLSTFC